MFGSVLEKLNGWFGQSFIVASLLPVLLFGGANIMMAGFLFPNALKATLAYFATWPFAPLEFTASFLIVCAILAYASDPLVRLAIDVLRGVNWPKGLRALGIANETVKLQALEKTQREIGGLGKRLPKEKCDELTNKLIDARLRGIALGAIVHPEKIVAAETSVKLIEGLRNRGKAIDPKDLESAVSKLAEALEANFAGEDAIHKLAEALEANFAGSDRKTRLDINERSKREAKQAKRLDALYFSLLAAISYARKHGISEWTAAANRRNRRMPRTSLAPTELGNKYAVLDDYLDDVFTIDIDFFLPIIRMVVAKDTDASSQLASAQQRLDFAARTLVLVVLFTAIWLIAVALAPGSIAAVALVGSGGLVVAALVIEVIKASFDNYGETLRAICILKRFEVLTALHMKLPVDWAAERTLWTSINQQLQWGVPPQTEIKYEPPAK